MGRINLAYLKKAVPKFQKWLNSDEGEEFLVDGTVKDTFFEDNFSLSNINSIDEGVIRQLIRLLWSFGGWTNKDYIADKMLESKLSKIKSAFKILLYSDKPLAERFDRMRKIKMMGAASISEILAHNSPTEYPIYNRRAKSSLIKLGIGVKSLPKSAYITGLQYTKYVEIARTVLDEVEQAFPFISDFLQLNFLLYYISITIEEKAEKALVVVDEKFDHDTTIDQLLQLGDSLGFDIDKEVKITSGCRIDAVWKSKIANLGMITYAFEVQKSGSRDSAILNLQRISNADPTVQKVVFVAIDSEIEKIKAEIATLHEEFRNSVGYFKVNDLQEALLHQEALKNILASIGLMKTRTAKIASS